MNPTVDSETDKPMEVDEERNNIALMSDYL